MQTSVLKYVFAGILLVYTGILTHVAYAGTEEGQVPDGWAVWSSWYWPFHDEYNPNLYDADEAMERYDKYDPEAHAQAWEVEHHGPSQNLEIWWGHCHAWAGAVCWEKQPSTDKVLSGMTFRVRDRKGLMIEMYYKCADGTHFELFADDPSPGLFWRYLRDEVYGNDSMHGHGMAFVVELYYGSEIWNYPIYKYKVNYSDSSPHSGTMTIWIAASGQPSYADSTTLYYHTLTYHFQGVIGDGKDPIDSGTWIGSGPYHRPDAIWRPYYPMAWTQYSKNPELDEAHINTILSEEALVEENKVYKYTVTVPGDTQWMDTGITVSVGDTITFTAQGTVVYDDEGYACGAAGTTWNDTRDKKDPLWKQPHAGVIGKIEGTSLPFFIGDTYTVKARSSGMLFLGINDYWYQGNFGKFTVTIQIKKAS